MFGVVVYADKLRVTLEQGDPKACWWTFDGIGDELRLDGASAAAQDFEPDDDFSVVMWVKPTNVTGDYEGLMGKWNSNGNHRCWVLATRGNQIAMNASENGINTQEWSLQNCLHAGEDTFLSFRYKYSGVPGGTSEMWLRCKDSFADQNRYGATARGPIYKDTDADVTIANYDAPADRHIEFSFYCIAYYSRKISDAEENALESGTSKPWDIPNLAACFLFCKNVTGTYQAEIGNGPNAPYIFVVGGDPVKHP
jgi:hypothetical protein